jgi:NADPH:quinone reductase-like Zn-dependent oxidoreductase
MKAVVYTKYGSPDVLQLKDVEKPTPKDNEVLVKVFASSINSWDWDLLRGTFMVRLGGLLKPKYKILGADISGRVEAVGKNTTQFQPGDEVYGDISGCGWGGFAEYVSVPENVLALKPANLTFEEAAAAPQAAVAALQGLRDKRQIQPGQKVLINGAGGGMGTFAIQIAKSFGAEVTAVDKSGKLDMMRSIGADYVIDYTQEDFTKKGLLYDLILDMSAFRSISDYVRSLGPQGIHVIVGGSTRRFIQALFLGQRPSITEGKKVSLLMHKPNNKDLDILKELLESGKVKPVIDRCFPLNEVSDAFRYFGEGNVIGKLVITMEELL